MNKAHLTKKLENYWFYYKIPTLIGIAVLFLALYFALNRPAQADYDYRIALAVTEIPGDDELQALEAALLVCAKDRNKDGKTAIEIIPYVFQQEDGADPQRALTTQVQFIADMELGITPLLIYSEEFYEIYKEEGTFPGNVEERLLLKDHYNGLPVTLSTMSITLFDYDRIDDNRKDDIESYYQDCRQLLDAIYSTSAA